MTKKGFFYQVAKSTKKRTLPGNGSPDGKKKRSTKTIGGGDPCERCGLYATCISPKMPVTGDGEKKILIVAEAPGKTEDAEGTQLIGEAGQVLREYLSLVDIDLDADCWKTNALICRPPKNRTPTNSEINCCRPNLLRTIDQLQPRKIIVLGKVALQALIGHRASITGIEQWTGSAIPDQELKCWVFPTWHPAYILRNRGDQALKEKFFTHLETACEWVEVFPDNTRLLDRVHTTTDPVEAIKFLDTLLNPTKYGHPVTIDIETTGIKPHHPDHMIKCIAFSTSGVSGISFPIFYDNEQFMDKLREVLTNSNIGKVAHNLKYEDEWIRIKFGYQVKGWMFDTMVGQHILDNRTGVTALKFQTYLRYGILGYEDSIQKYIKSASSNGFNTIDKCPMDELLKYNALDTLFTYRLYQDITKALLPQQFTAYKLFHDGILSFSKIQEVGIRLDTDLLKKTATHLERRLEREKEKIQSMEEVVGWKNEYKVRGHFNPNSPKQLSSILFQYLKYKPSKYTQKENISTDQSVLEGYNTPFTNTLVKYRKLEKLRGTYLENFMVEEINGYMHPSFNLHIARTYRSSSSNPNFQNIPVRDEEAQKITRPLIIPRRGRRILEVDYSSVEVRVSACNHKDPAMIEYINDPTTDMHRDSAMKLFKIDDPTQVPKHLRQGAKNGFVFPQFYGDYFGNCSRNIWENWLKDDDKELLKKKGLRSFQSFENHVKAIEEWFWNTKFKRYTEWKDEILMKYIDDGYIDLLTGFRCHGPMDKKEVWNYPIQGPAFHCLLWSLNRIQEYISAERMRTLLIGQIHDSILFDLIDEELAQLLPVVKRIMCDDIRKFWEWIIVPLEIEAEITEVDGSWYTKKKIEI